MGHSQSFLSTEQLKTTTGMESSPHDTSPNTFSRFGLFVVLWAIVFHFRGPVVRILKNFNPLLFFETLRSKPSGVSMQIGWDAKASLPAERKNKTRFETICYFRLEPDVFPIERALQEYHREPICYALALTELNTEVFTATGRRNPSAVGSFVRHLRSQRRIRDILGGETYETAVLEGHSSFLQIFRYCKTRLLDVLETPLVQSDPAYVWESLGRWDEETKLTSGNAWEKHFQNFVKNVNFFCQHTGSEVDDLALPQETINSLRKFASDRRQELAPLLEVNARLTKELSSCKRVNAALQTRHTIEKLVFELPSTVQYDLLCSGPKWEVLWHQIWADASKNVNNPFHKLWAQSKGEYARNDIRDKGKDLFAAMSGEIHGYDQGQRNAFDYEHFDVSVRKVAKVLHENPIIDQKTGDVDWIQEIRKYPVAWPAADNLALTELQRLEGRVNQLQRRLNSAVVERDRFRAHQAWVKESRAKGEDDRQRRKRDREANDSAQDDSEDVGLDALYGFEQ